MPSEVQPPREFLSPLVEQWLEKIGLAEKAKKPFDDIAAQCDMFFSKASGSSMWKEDYRAKYIGAALTPPNMQITLNKAFELVALFGPYLYWQYPQVHIESYDPVASQLPPELFTQLFSGTDGAAEMGEQLHQQAMQETHTEQIRQQARNLLMETYLNWAQKEQPGGGMAVHAEIAITEALVKGRSCMWVEAYQPTGSNRNLTQARWRNVDDLLIDPDAKDPTLSDAKFIVLRHYDTTWEVEKKFNLPRGYLRSHGAFESNDSRAANRSDTSKRRRKAGQAHDMVEWFEIWSKGGVGTRLSSMDNADRTMIGRDLHDAFDEVVGDYAYICVAENVDFPLNAPSWMFRDPQTNEPTGSDEDIVEAFSWRAANYGPVWQSYMDDGAWPVVVLDFYRSYGSAWPIAPLGPALGELTILNILISAYTELAYDNRKTIIAYLESQAKLVKEALEGNDNPAFIAIQDTAVKSINEIVQYLKRPEMNNDLLEAIAYVERLFEQRSGLNEFLYAMQTTQSRTARDVAAKEEKAHVRPEKMSKDVASFLTITFRRLKHLAGWIVEGQDLMPLLGRYGAYFWDTLISAEDPEVYVREMRATVEANDVRKPNRDRLLANVRDMMQYLLPLLQEYAQITGNSDPLNQFLKNLDRALEDKIVPEFGPWRPEPDEQQQQMQQMQMELEQAKLQAEVMGKQLDVQNKEVELEQSKVELQNGGTDARKKQLELVFDQFAHEQERAQDEETHEQELFQDRQKFFQDLVQKREENRVKIDGMRQQNALKAQAARKQPSGNGSAA